jgi:hypothetical protein
LYNLKQLSLYLGHKSVSFTEYYIHPTTVTDEMVRASTAITSIIHSPDEYDFMGELIVKDDDEKGTK